MIIKILVIFISLVASACLQATEEQLNNVCSDFPLKNINAMSQSATNKCATFGVEMDQSLLKQVLKPSIENDPTMATQSCISQCKAKIEHETMSSTKCVQWLINEGVKGFDETFTDRHLISADKCNIVISNMEAALGK